MVMQDIFDMTQSKDMGNWKGISKALQKEVQDCVRETFVRVV